MALVVEDGTGVAGANSYSSVECPPTSASALRANMAQQVDRDAEVSAYLTNLVRTLGVKDVRAVPIDGVWTFVADRKLSDGERKTVESLASRFIQAS